MKYDDISKIFKYFPTLWVSRLGCNAAMLVIVKHKNSLAIKKEQVATALQIITLSNS